MAIRGIGMFFGLLIPLSPAITAIRGGLVSYALISIARYWHIRHKRRRRPQQSRS